MPTSRSRLAAMRHVRRRSLSALTTTAVLLGPMGLVLAFGWRLPESALARDHFLRSPWSWAGLTTVFLMIYGLTHRSRSRFAHCATQHREIGTHESLTCDEFKPEAGSHRTDA